MSVFKERLKFKNNDIKSAWRQYFMKRECKPSGPGDVLDFILENVSTISSYTISKYSISLITCILGCLSQSTTLHADSQFQGH